MTPGSSAWTQASPRNPEVDIDTSVSILNWYWLLSKRELLEKSSSSDLIWERDLWVLLRKSGENLLLFSFFLSYFLVFLHPSSMAVAIGQQHQRHAGGLNSVGWDYFSPIRGPVISKSGVNSGCCFIPCSPSS